MDQGGAILVEAKVSTCPDALANWLTERSDELERLGMETGPLAVWLWNALTLRELPIVCIDARHANGVLKMMLNKTDRHDARGLAQIGKRFGGFKQRAEEIIERELAVAPDLVPIFEALMQARRDILARIAALDSWIRGIAKRHATVRLLMTAPGVGPITAMAVVAAFDDATRFRRSSSAGAYLGLTPRRYASGETSHNGRVSKRGDRFTRKCLSEAVNAIYCRNGGGPRLCNWAKAIAERTGPRKAKVALARKLAVSLHAMWRTNTPFREAAMA